LGPEGTRGTVVHRHKKGAGSCSDSSQQLGAQRVQGGTVGHPLGQLN